MIDKVDNRKNNGGLPGTGRKSIIDKAIPVLFYAKKSLIKKHGGIEKVREKCKKLVSE